MFDKAATKASGGAWRHLFISFHGWKVFKSIVWVSYSCAWWEHHNSARVFCEGLCKTSRARSAASGAKNLPLFRNYVFARCHGSGIYQPLSKRFNLWNARSSSSAAHKRSESCTNILWKNARVCWWGCCKLLLLKRVLLALLVCELRECSQRVFYESVDCLQGNLSLYFNPF